MHITPPKIRHSSPLPRAGGIGGGHAPSRTPALSMRQGLNFLHFHAQADVPTRPLSAPVHSAKASAFPANRIKP